MLALEHCRTWVADEIDITTIREDHKATALDCTFVGLGPKPRRRSAVPQLDIDRMVSTLKDEQGKDLLGKAALGPGTDWTIDVHQHYELLTQHISTTLCEPFRKTGKKKLKTYLSDSTWDLICHKQRLRQRMSQTAKACGHALLNVCFQVWKGSDPTELDQRQALHRANALAYAAFRKLGKQVTTAVRQDDSTFFEEIVQKTRQMDESNDSQGLWRQLRRVLPKYKNRRKQQPLALQGLQDEWIPHFSALEAGIPSTIEDLHQQCLNFQNSCEDSSYTSTTADLPTLLEIEKLMRSMAANKTPGVDGIPSEAYKLSSRYTAPLLHDLFLKVTLWGCEPLQGKGGNLIPIHKSGPTTEVRNYRGILLLNNASKLYHAWLRSKLLPLIQPYKPIG